MIHILIITGILAGLFLAVWAVLHHPAFGPHPFGHTGRNFRNEVPTPQFTGERSSGVAAMWKFLTDRTNERVPKKPLEIVRTDIRSLSKESDWFIWFGHSSYLFTLGGKTVLVDPLLKMEFPASVMMKPFPGTDYYTPDMMPDIDLLVITHEHWDHLDYATLRDLRPRVKHAVCPLGIAEYLTLWGYPPEIITEMNWYDHTQISNVKYQISNLKSQIHITCLPTRHFSNRLFGANETLWASFLLESRGRKVYIGGDGGYDSRFKRICEQYGEVDLAIMENGQYNPNWAYIHMLPEDLEKAMTDLQAKQYITVHHDKFSLAPHAWNEPDSVARSIARKDHITLLDRPIGAVIEW